MKKIYMMKCFEGAGLIAAGVIVSYIINGLVLAGRYISVKPDHKGAIMSIITLVPFFCYLCVYITRFYYCVRRNARTNDVYKNEIWQITATVAGNIVIMIALLSAGNILGEASSYMIISSIITTIFFVLAFLLCKPF